MPLLHFYIGEKVQYQYLFGSYAKGNATEGSDVDLLVSTDVRGLKFYGLAEKRYMIKDNRYYLNKMKDNCVFI